MPKGDRVASKSLVLAVEEMMKREGQVKNQKELVIPDYLICPIAGDLMTDPVLIQSGQTFERSVIEKHFEMQTERAEKKR